MSILNKNFKKEIKAHAKSEEPNECCGVIYQNKEGQYKLLKCKNVATDKQNYFEVDAMNYLKASREGEIKGYYHSHVNDSKGEFSDMDLGICRAHGLSLVMYSMLQDKFFEINYDQ